MYFCDAKAEFFVSLLQSSQSRNSSEIILICWFGAKESCAAYSFCGKSDTFFDEQKVQSNSKLL